MQCIMHINGHEKFLIDSANNVAVQYFLSKPVRELHTFQLRIVPHDCRYLPSFQKV